MGRAVTSWRTCVSVVLACFLLITFAGLLRYNAQIEAYRGALTVAGGDELGLSGIATGMAGSIGGAMLVGALVFASLLVTAWVTADVRWSIALAALLMLPLGAFNLGVAHYVQAHPDLLTRASKMASSYSGQALSTLEEAFFPVAVGLGFALFIASRRREQLEREAFRVPVASRAERERVERESDEARLRARGRVPAIVFAAEPDDSANDASSESGAPASAIADPGQPPPRAGMSVVCAACGAANPPLCETCARCGATFIV